MHPKGILSIQIIQGGAGLPSINCMEPEKEPFTDSCSCKDDMGHNQNSDFRFYRGTTIG